MELKDIIIYPIFLAITYYFLFYFKSKITNIQARKHFISAATLKIVGGLAFGFIYQFYYEGGDTLNYYNSAKVIYNAFINDPLVGIKILFLSNGEFSSGTFNYTSLMWGFTSKANFFVIKLAAFFGLFCFHTFSVITLFFALISFSGLWKMYMTFLKVYPNLHKQFAIAIFYIPSLFFWGSGIMKDTVCIGAIGWVFYCFYKAFIEKKEIFKNIIILVASIWILKEVKTYIILCFFPAAIYWIFATYGSSIKNSLLRIISKPVIIVIGVVIGVIGGKELSEESERYSIENIGETAVITSNYLERQTILKATGVRTGSNYNIGTIDGSIGSMIKAAPQAIIVTLYRPFLFEVKNPVMLLAAVESTWILIFTIYILFKVGFIKTFKSISSPTVSFCLIFSIVSAIGIGLTSGNFGTLVRYKIPLLPFYVSALFIIANKHKITKKKT